MSIFSYFDKKRREQRKKLRELRQFSSTFSTLDRLEQSGLLTFDSKSRRLFIAQSLAVLTLLKSPEAYAVTVQNLYLWTYWQQIQQVTAETMLRAELAAVCKASVDESHQTVQLSRADVDRIRLAARQQVAESDIDPPKVEPFEMFIVEDTVDAKPRIIAVGYFNPETNDMELAPWSEVEPLIRKSDGQASA